MKTLLLSLGLLLLAACCCNAIPSSLQFSAFPVNCCFDVSNQSIPLKFVSKITPTHRSCQNKAFIVKTIKGKTTCYSGTNRWAMNAYKKLHGSRP
ncbi:hypothetical protein PBY51_012447 [Eleginops maclovinus]|uniref:Chemokine interleukin-8-like domain-containing protein n=2 Tax=Eleginops maclovinus TaxID=56733 RepID=A0AAN7XVZ2_ELEMC|nr:hypothetical protein PBY51_012447 [Eleginops maclovinus]